VTLTGLNAAEFSRTEADFKQVAPDDLMEKKKEDGDIIESSPVHVEFMGLNRAEDFSGSTYTIRANVCYKYGTDAISNICIRKNNLDSKEGVCEVNEEKTIFTSGAPVQVTTFKESARAKDKVGFSFTVAHKGNGRIYKLGSSCGDENRRQNEDVVWVEVKSDLAGLECNGLNDGTEITGYTKLYGGDKVIQCTQTLDTGIDQESSYLMIMKIIQKLKCL